MTHVFPCTDCGTPTPTKLRKPKRCAPCAKADALDCSRWNYRAHHDELLAYHRKRYAGNRERILAQRAAKRRARESTCSSATPSTGDGTTPSPPAKRGPSTSIKAGIAECPLFKANQTRSGWRGMM